MSFPPPTARSGCASSRGASAGWTGRAGRPSRPESRRSSLPLDPLLEALRAERIASGARPLYELTVEEARAADRAAPAEPAEAVAHVVDREIPGPEGAIPIRVYSGDEPGPHPVLVWFFGGGWVLGSIESSDPICRRLANAARCAVVAVGYRLAPEHRYPAAVFDCYSATCWVAEHGAELGLDPRRVAVGGGSAGANLAAAVTLLARDRGAPPLVHQVLFYPVVDYRADTPSMRECGDPYFLDARVLAWCWGHYLPSAKAGDDLLVSPSRSPDLSGLPPALVVTAECDPLRDEGERYASRLAAAGVPVEATRYDGVVHGFVALGRLDAARAAVEQAGRALRRRFAA